MNIILKTPNIKIFPFSFIGLVLIICTLSCDNHDPSEKNIFIGNGKISLGFDKKTGAFLVFEDLINSYNFLDEKVISGLPWEVHSFQSSEIVRIDDTNVKFSFRKPNSYTLNLKWKYLKGTKHQDLIISAVITLDRLNALSYWEISLIGINDLQIYSVVFPKIEGIKDLGNEELAVPRWMGQLTKEPRTQLSKTKKMEYRYPGPLSMQCLALYNPDKCGFYASCADSLSYVKDFSFTLDTLNSLSYTLINYPALDSTRESFTLPYSAVIGSFKGDWITAAELYREWGTKQKWCTDSRLKNGFTPSWLENTALWVWNRGYSENVLTPAVELKNKTGLPISVFWHWWHGCSYDDNFPEYFPPRDGKKSFIKAVTSAQSEGVRSIVYMNQLQWGNSAESFRAENASLYTVKDVHGKMISHAYNRFTGNSLTNMCLATKFWKDKYASLCDSAVNTYKTNGVYMDQACISRMCYDASHGHDIGGGNYWIKNNEKLTSQIRSTISKTNEPILTGEGCGESWLPHLDAMLTLQVSAERYGGVSSSETIPFFQAVYHEFGITYGNYSSLVQPPYDDLWPKEFAPSTQLQLLDRDFNKQFLMEQARSFVWGMQPTIANYRSFLLSERKEEMNYLLDIARIRYQGLKYLLYGKFLRTLDIEIPEEEIKISRLSIYAGRTGNVVTSLNKRVPLIYTGTWKSEDNDIGIALASISDDALPVNFSLNSKDYDLSASGKIYFLNAKGKTLLKTYSNGLVSFSLILEPGGLCLIEIVPEM